MGRSHAFTPTVAARTRAAKAILEDASLVEGFENFGGLREDLELIISSGLAAEAANAGQSVIRGESIGATKESLLLFESLRRDYAQIMNVVFATRAELARKGAPADLLASVDKIVKNEGAVRLVAVKTEDGEVVKRARRSQSHRRLREGRPRGRTRARVERVGRFASRSRAGRGRPRQRAARHGELLVTERPRRRDGPLVDYDDVGSVIAIASEMQNLDVERLSVEDLREIALELDIPDKHVVPAIEELRRRRAEMFAAEAARQKRRTLLLRAGAGVVGLVVLWGVVGQASTTRKLAARLFGHPTSIPLSNELDGF